MSAFMQPPRIAILPGTLVNQIAAGEVIERPASVVKELIENSIDAGATRIDIDIDAGGTKTIIIRDNGCGIHPDDMELAIMRHTTSKLRSREDLDVILSLGFRGEALSSIASVSDFCITSRIVSEDHAYRLRVNSADDRTELAPAAHPVGTTVEVLNLFHNVPARRKFLRSERTEFLHILEMVKCLVMSRFDININLRHNGKPVLICPAVESDFRARIQTVMGRNFYQNARPIDAQAGHMQIYGWLGGAGTARSQSDQQYLCLNKRMIRDRQITHAIRMAIETDLPASRYPAYILYVQIDPSLVDVNVHPTKQEVRFRQPREVHDFVFAALRNPVVIPGADRRNDQFMSDVTQPVFTTGHVSAGTRSNLREQATAYAVSVAESLPDSQIDPLGTPVAMLHGCYVLAVHAGELRIIDINKLKYAYLYRRLEQDFREKNLKTRLLLVPLMFTITERDLQRLSPCFDLLAELGLQIELSGPQSVVIRSLPALLPDLEFRPLLNGLIATMQGLHAETTGLADIMLQLLVSHATKAVTDRCTLQQIGEQLRLISTSGLPVTDRNHAGVWRTLLIPELQSLLNDKP